MIPYDKFGNQIYRHTFEILRENGNILIKLGYKESSNKPNLFYLKSNCATFFADMRGTEDVSIWEDTRPLIYWKFEGNFYNWEKRRSIKSELERLFKALCPCRLSFYLFNNIEFENIGFEINEENGIYNWDDGYCLYCGKDFKDEGSFCSSKCKEEFQNSLIRICEVCGRKVHDWDDFDSIKPLDKLCTVCNNRMCVHNSVKHHISYFPEKIIDVHRSCHLKIHRTDSYPYLKPKDSDIDKFYHK